MYRHVSLLQVVVYFK